MSLYQRKNSRGKIEILACILIHCQVGLKKTHVMLKAKIGYGQLCYYLPKLVDCGLLSQLIECGSVKYRTTDNGREFLQSYYNIMRLMNQVNLGQEEFGVGEKCINLVKISAVKNGQQDTIYERCRAGV